MDGRQLFLQRYTVLYDFWIGDLWQMVPDELMRQRPHPRVNSIVWNLWHLLRVEDAALNRFVADCSQVLDEGQWMQHMNVPWRHNSFGMTFAEVDDLNQRIDLQALRAYSLAVHSRTLEIVDQIEMGSLESAVEVAHLRKVLFGEGLAIETEATGLLENYTGWTKAKFLMNLGLTHSFQHVGEIGVLASLLGLEL